MEYTFKDIECGKQIEDTQRIFYIEYFDGIPHSVTTAKLITNKKGKQFWCPRHWDFFLNDGDKEDIRYYEAGSGGDLLRDGIYAPQFVESGKSQIWKDPEVKFNGEPKNTIILDNPLNNPFENATESSGYHYCERCDKHHDDSYETYFCEHIEMNDDYELIYKDTKEHIS